VSERFVVWEMQREAVLEAGWCQDHPGSASDLVELLLSLTVTLREQKELKQNPESSSAPFRKKGWKHNFET
jgi:hypothetical protein